MFSISCMHFKFEEKQKLLCEHVSIQKKKKNKHSNQSSQHNYETRQFVYKMK